MQRMSLGGWWFCRSWKLKILIQHNMSSVVHWAGIHHDRWHLWEWCLFFFLFFFFTARLNTVEKRMEREVSRSMDRRALFYLFFFFTVTILIDQLKVQSAAYNKIQRQRLNIILAFYIYRSSCCTTVFLLQPRATQTKQQLFLFWAARRQFARPLWLGL